MRISRDEMLMYMAHVASLRGTCNRLKVGAVLAVQNRPISLGYNGAPSGVPHCDSSCNPDNPCRNTVHAEQNALEWAKAFGASTQGTTLYITDSPCILCAHLILRYQVSRVVYDRDYRISAGIDLLKQNKVEVNQCSIKNVTGVSCLTSPTTHVCKV